MQLKRPIDKKEEGEIEVAILSGKPTQFEKKYLRQIERLSLATALAIKRKKRA